MQFLRNVSFPEAHHITSGKLDSEAYESETNTSQWCIGSERGADMKPWQKAQLSPWIDMSMLLDIFL